MSNLFFFLYIPLFQYKIHMNKKYKINKEKSY